MQWHLYIGARTDVLLISLRLEVEPKLAEIRSDPIRSAPSSIKFNQGSVITQHESCETVTTNQTKPISRLRTYKALYA